jgi:DNA-binding MarR family transcriptional regulator
VNQSNQLEEDILIALRRITRAIGIHSRYLASNFGLTGPQLVCLRVVARLRTTTPSELARQVALSQATVTGIVDRLVRRDLITRGRSETDRRHVQLSITDAGLDLVAKMPSPLQVTFARRLSELSDDQQEHIRSTLQTIVTMMDGDDIDAAPVLSTETVLENGLSDADDE